MEDPFAEVPRDRLLHRSEMTPYPIVYIGSKEIEQDYVQYSAVQRIMYCITTLQCNLPTIHYSKNTVHCILHKHRS